MSSSVFLNRGFVSYFHVGHQGSILPTFLRAAFTSKDPKSTKDSQVISALLQLLESAPVKAACKMLVKLTPNVLFFLLLRT